MPICELRFARVSVPVFVTLSSNSDHSRGELQPGSRSLSNFKASKFLQVY
jgi:hypothetical protein